MVTEGKLYLS